MALDGEPCGLSCCCRVRAGWTSSVSEGGAPTATERTILVTGDVVVALDVYEGLRRTPDSPVRAGMMGVHRSAGAMLTYELLRALRAASSVATSTIRVAFGLEQTTEADLRDWPAQFTVGALWEGFAAGKSGDVWRMSKRLGYGCICSGPYPATPARGLGDIDAHTLVIDDGSLGFRHETASRCWPPAIDGGTVPDPRWIVLRTTSPLGRGDLWRKLLNRHADRLVVIISAEDLRGENVRLAKASSWESSAQDLIAEMRANPLIGELGKCRHLLITIGGDAAIWLDQPATSEHNTCRLVFDRERGEGEWEDSLGESGAAGYHSAVTASVAWTLANSDESETSPDLASALKAGLSATRFVREYGHGPVGKGNGEPGFPSELVAREVLSPTHRYASGEIAPREAVCNGWTLLRESAHTDVFPGPLFGPARRLALVGPAALANVPCARFAKLLTMDRCEIEALRSLRQLMLAYHAGHGQEQPLSIAVFGAPGAGKSFGLKQVARGVFGERNEILEFNLSQFRAPEDLIGAYHQVRDSVLAGNTPVVFWDEFDSRNYFWLQYLLAPMQDGVFREGQIVHPIGKCVFVFAGGTSRDFAHFGPSAEPKPGESNAQRKAREDFVFAKGPDFKSRLSGFFDVTGPNPRQVYDDEKAAAGLNPWQDDPDDLEFPVRRAILLRALLGLGAREAAPLPIDTGLLGALLEVGHYANGARSMEKLVGQLRDRGGLPLHRSGLPPDDLLSLYIDDVEEFKALIRRSHRFLAQSEKLAPLFHEDWRTNLLEGEKSNVNNVPFEQLTPEEKAANVTAAARMPDILALVGFALVEGQATPAEDESVQIFISEHLDLLAEAEHDGWADQKRMEGWTRGKKRDDVARVHDLLVPYAELPEEQKEKDRRTIRAYPAYARQAGFKIVPLSLASR
jgi:hypothetical protein